MADRSYEDTGYWEKRYAEDSGETFEWFLSFDDLSPLLQKYISSSKEKPTKTAFNILDIGCGNSNFLLDLGSSVVLDDCIKVGDEWENNCVGIDVSSKVVEDMKERVKRNDSLRKLCQQRNLKFEFRVCDVSQQMPFQDEYFDVIIDKATMDTLLHNKTSCEAENSSSPSTVGVKIVEHMLREIARMLVSDHGVYVLVSQMNIEKEEDESFLTHSIIPSLTNAGAVVNHYWDIHVHSSEDSPFTVYVFQKKKLHSMRRRSQGRDASGTELPVLLKRFYH